jgi:signal peptidase I
MSMDRARRLEHSLPGLFEELADARTPDYLEAAIEGASSRPRRPSWTFPTRWLPMEITTTRVPASRVPWRQLGVLALIAILLAAMLAVYIGSHQQRLPPPFGVAGNGLVAYAQKGDIFTVDPVTGVSTPIVTGKPYDSDPRFSRDGTRVVFTRNEGGSIRLFASGTDGAAVTPITPGPVNLTGSRQGEPWDQYQFAPDGRSVVVASIEDGLAGISNHRSARQMVGRCCSSAMPWDARKGPASMPWMSPAATSVRSSSRCRNTTWPVRPGHRTGSTSPTGDGAVQSRPPASTP